MSPAMFPMFEKTWAILPSLVLWFGANPAETQQIVQHPQIPMDELSFHESSEDPMRLRYSLFSQCRHPCNLRSC